MSSRDYLHFSRRFLLPIIAAATVAVVGLTGFLVWSAERIDTNAHQRESQLLERALSELQVNMRTAQQDIAIWDEAVTAYERGDVSWLADNVGTYAYETYGHNRIYLVDPKLDPVMAVNDGGYVSTESSKDTLARLKPMLEKLGTLEVQAAISAFNTGVAPIAPSLVEFTMLEGHPALVGAIPLLSLSGDNAPDIGSEAIFISVVLLDDKMALYLGDQYLVDNPAFTDREPNGSAVSVVDSAGKTIAWLHWTAAQPGSDLIKETIPALVVGLIIIALIVGQLLLSLRQALRQLRAEREDAHHRALHDPLTGLGNRSLFQSRLSECFAPHGGQVALLALDLDHFKRVNDTMGHAAGDDVLIEVAARLKLLLDKRDTVVRLGGDEFAIIRQNVSVHADTEILAARIVEALSAPIMLSTGQARIGVSIGIASTWTGSRSAEQLERHADDALYRAKNSGRNRYCFYTRAAENEPLRREAELRDAFEARRA